MDNNQSPPVLKIAREKKRRMFADEPTGRKVAKAKARNNAPLPGAKPETRSKSETVSELLDSIDDALALPLPEKDAEGHLAERYIKRAYAALKRTETKVAKLQWRIGRVLVDLKRKIAWGEWTAYVENKLGLQIRTANNYLNMALGVTEEFAASHTLTECYEEAGMPMKARDKTVGVFIDRLDALVLESLALKKKIQGIASQFRDALIRVDKSHLKELNEQTDAIIRASQRIFGGCKLQIAASSNEIDQLVKHFMPEAFEQKGRPAKTETGPQIKE